MKRKIQTAMTEVRIALDQVSQPSVTILSLEGTSSAPQPKSLKDTRRMRVISR